MRPIGAIRESPVCPHARDEIRSRAGRESGYRSEIPSIQLIESSLYTMTRGQFNQDALVDSYDTVTTRTHVQVDLATRRFQSRTGGLSVEM